MLAMFSTNILVFTLFFIFFFSKFFGFSYEESRGGVHPFAAKDNMYIND